ncbi:MAG: LLM class flavin-dependent oxidoreductase [SAR202 cluster bacterium]|uniref:Luciferase-like domain-containing protein n=1 Tax=hydrothermal vent metagenome TaxID=652676 RepID=A0A160VBR3_9ZZZZ|nr:LLM class flavin-dependent oxidoreductase [Dehalococcoidia bacterium]MQF91979.1 LLM class flavin-dependent oxidoreductase [SAR202 cluster bacterium]MQG42331.1 LLM class flavin-dependent oxidoreductase [SAR202 cluster bacterium]MQG61121.1 LLM class flavin-dependent oxidoreductase [SAR202 cluster bacterium]MQG65387.1 LLM class flavin-dependent oxidoreductase [SAR202 cluster bacterium]|tara:strand:- start:2269 stop:3438 length:1170 start_codon:yes stop_codon:yes gene_type:complete
MITKFGSLFAGHVDFEDLGFDATPVNERRLTDERLAGVFGKAEAIVLKMEDLGYDTFWSAEHHFQHEGYECIPNLLMMYVHLANLTKNLKFGCGFNVNPMWHPLRLAEDYATADILTGGRVIFGVGRGYHSREVDTFGVPSTITDNDANREMFEEQVEIIMKAFNEESFSYKGKFYDLPPEVPYRGYTLKEITLVPRPRTLPVETYQPIVSASQRAMDFMAKHGIKGIIGGGAAAGGAQDQVITQWRDTLAMHGRDTELGTDLIIGYSIQIADTEDQAIKEATHFFEENMKMFAPLGFVRGLSDDQMAALAQGSSKARSAQLPTLEEGVKAGSWLCGPSEMVTDKLLDVQTRYPGLEQVNVGSVIGTPQNVILEQLERFGKEVMPEFKK